MPRRRFDSGHSLADVGLILWLVAMAIIVALYVANGEVSVLDPLGGSV